MNEGLKEGESERQEGGREGEMKSA
jgi:hypothetical protein